MAEPLIVNVEKNNKLDSLVFLRGVAVIMVCFCHFGNALSQGGIYSAVFRNFHTYGLFGVHIFFVISGFVIPLSLLNGKYRVRDYPLFLYKRVVRLHPPYLAALLLTLVVMYFSYESRHVAFPENPGTILESLVYFHLPADNPVFWTLIIEMEFYMLIGLLYGIIIRYPVMAVSIFIPVIIGISRSFISQYVAFSSYSVFFFIGTIGFLIYKNIGNRALNIAALVLLLVYTAFFYELPAFICALFAVTCMLTYRSAVPGILKFPGKISYSVYLIHFVIGVKLINVIEGKINSSWNWLLFIITLIIIFGASWIFYNLFESFSEKLSKKVKYSAVKKYRMVTPYENVKMQADIT